MVQDIIVFAIISATLAYVVYSLIRTPKTKKDCGCGGCNGCEIKEFVKNKQSACGSHTN